MCDNHGLVDDTSWIRKKIMSLYSQWIDDTLGFYLFLGRACQYPVVGPLIRYFACLYGQYFHGGRAADPDECYEIIDRATTITVVNCACRERIKSCTSPMQACIMVNTGAEVFSETKNSSLVTGERAKAIVHQSLEAGLIRNIHQCFSPNIYSICNCCTCCCVPYKLRKDYGVSTAVVNGAKIPLLHQERCKKCLKCIKICPEGAIDLDTGFIREDKCLGCGLCVHVCSEQALTMTDRAKAAAVVSVGTKEKMMMYVTFILFILPLAAGYKMINRK